MRNVVNGQIIKANSRNLNLVMGKLYEINEILTDKRIIYCTLIGMKNQKYPIYLFKEVTKEIEEKYKMTQQMTQRLNKLKRLKQLS